MPSTRRLRVTACIVLLSFLVILYVTRGASSTSDSPFYTRTIEAIKNRKDAESRRALLEEERDRKERMGRIEKEHAAAISMKASAAQPSPHNENVKDDAKSAADRSSSGRRKSTGERVVDGRPGGDKDDGVAKVGNVAQKSAGSVRDDPSDPESAQKNRVEAELGAILKKGPIIIFSKSYCPYSKKAKHILLDLYDISPPPYVVELDQHELGPDLQAALKQSTGRGTVPNVLINGKSIGGGDDVQHLHEEGQLSDTIRAMGGQRIVQVSAKEAHA